MNKEQLEARIKEITNAIEQSAQNHNALLGRLSEAQFMLEEMNKVAGEIEDAVVVAEEVV